MTRTLLTLFIFLPSLCVARPGSDAPVEKKRATSSVDASYMDSDPDQCVTDDGNNDDPGWDVFENAIPACQRAVIIFEANVRLDLGAKPVMKNYPNGMNTVKATVVSGRGSYDAEGNVTDLKGLTVWVSLDRCQLRNVYLRDENDHDVDSLLKARYILAPQEGLSGIANGNGLKGYQDDCHRAPASKAKPEASTASPSH